MYSVCKICGRTYSGLNCLKCTQTSFAIVNFGDETIGTIKKDEAEISAKTPMGPNLAALKLPDGKVFAVPKPSCRIGSDKGNDIIINLDDSVSRFHAQIVFDSAEKEYVLRDLGTKVGTQLNGSTISLDAAIFDGDMIKIGKYKFYFVSDLDF